MLLHACRRVGSVIRAAQGGGRRRSGGYCGRSGKDFGLVAAREQKKSRFLRNCSENLENEKFAKNIENIDEHR